MRRSPIRRCRKPIPVSPSCLATVSRAPDGKAKFTPASVIPPDEAPDDEYPMIATTGRQLEHWHTGSMTRPIQRAGCGGARGELFDEPAHAQADGDRTGRDDPSDHPSRFDRDHGACRPGDCRRYGVHPLRLCRSGGEHPDPIRPSTPMAKSPSSSSRPFVSKKIEDAIAAE